MTVLEPLELNITSTSQDSVSCNGLSDGTARVNTVAGGNAPYSYLWNDAAATTVFQASNLPAGDYEVTVTDAKGCFKSTTVTVLEPPLLEPPLLSVPPLLPPVLVLSSGS